MKWIDCHQVVLIAQHPSINHLRTHIGVRQAASTPPINVALHRSSNLKQSCCALHVSQRPMGLASGPSTETPRACTSMGGRGSDSQSPFTACADIRWRGRCLYLQCHSKHGWQLHRHRCGESAPHVQRRPQRTKQQRRQRWQSCETGQQPTRSDAPCIGWESHGAQSAC
jgi:hypothetical protein